MFHCLFPAELPKPVIAYMCLLQQDMRQGWKVLTAVWDTAVTSKRAVKGILIHANACFVNVPADIFSSLNLVSMQFLAWDVSKAAYQETKL